jgi:2-iminobutanoate/2-iminopropanoate deaminase
MDKTPSVGEPRLRFVNPPELNTPVGYTHVVDARLGRIVYLSGQCSYDASGAIVGVGDIRAQTEQVFANLAVALASVGASFRDVVKLNWYVTDTSELPVFREVRDKYVDVERPPASTFVKVTRLVREEFLIEVECVAVVG